MQTHQDSSTAVSVLPLLQEVVCLVCGTKVPAATAPENLEEELRGLGWHSWASRVAVTPQRSRVSVLRLCPECVANPMFVATTILKNHGPDAMEEWIMSMEL